MYLQYLLSFDNFEIDFYFFVFENYFRGHRIVSAPDHSTTVCTQNGKIDTANVCSTSVYNQTLQVTHPQQHVWQSTINMTVKLSKSYLII